MTSSHQLLLGPRRSQVFLQPWSGCSMTYKGFERERLPSLTLEVQRDCRLRDPGMDTGERRLQRRLGMRCFLP